LEWPENQTKLKGAMVVQNVEIAMLSHQPSADLTSQMTQI